MIIYLLIGLLLYFLMRATHDYKAASRFDLWRDLWIIIILWPAWVACFSYALIIRLTRKK